MTGLPHWLTRNRMARLSALAVAVLVVGLLAANQYRLAQQQRAACDFWRHLGAFEVSDASSDIGRTLIADARAASETLDCP